MSEATQVLEGIKSLTAEEPPVLDVQAIADAAARKVVEALSAQPPAELGLPETDAATAVMEKPTTVSAAETAEAKFADLVAQLRGWTAGKIPRPSSAPAAEEPATVKPPFEEPHW
jgi:hypothetical protein